MVLFSNHILVPSPTGNITLCPENNYNGACQIYKVSAGGSVAQLGADIAGLPANGSVMRVVITMSGEPNDLANRAIVNDVRGRVVPAVVGGLPGVRAYVGGDAAFVLDTVKLFADRVVLSAGLSRARGGSNTFKLWKPS